MTNANDITDDAPPVPDDLSIIGAFLDGEDVSAQALRRALDDARVRDYLVDVLALRRSVGAMAPFSLAGAPQPRGRSRAWWGIAAAVATIVTAAGGYVVGERHGSVAADASDVSTVPVVPAPSAPTPTKVIRFVPGENWHVTGGQ